MNSVHTTPGEAHRRYDRRSGQMLIFVCLSLFVLFAAIGFSVDLGYAYMIKVTAQTAADSAAQAAAIYAGKNGYGCGSGGLTCNTAYTCTSPAVTPPTTAMEAGCLYAQANGFVNTGSQTVTLIANNTTPPNESGNASPALWIQASVTQTVKNSFLYWAGFQTGSVASQAIAGVNLAPPTSCVYVLSSSAPNALSVTGSSHLTSSGCSIWVNATGTTVATAAIQDTGSSSITATNGSIYAMTGAYTTPGGTSTISTITRTSTATADPLINLPPPTVSSAPCDAAHNSYSLGSSNTDTIGPGVYCNGITVSGSATLNLKPGVYILNGGGLNNTHSGTINCIAFNGVAAGVTFFLTGQNGYTMAGMQLVGNSISNLTASATGTYQGILFYQDRGSAAYALANDLSNSATLTASGTFYFPNTALDLTGNVTTGTIGIVANTLEIVGSSTFNKDVTGTLTGLHTVVPGLIQ